MSFLTFQLGNALVQLCVAIGMFAHTLTPRSRFWQRVVLTVASAILVTVACAQAGFSLYPQLTDDLSFSSAIVSFLLVLAFMVGAQMFLWECSLLTALYCCTSAYLLENLSDGVVRLLRISGIAPGDPASFLVDKVPIADVALSIACALAVYLMVYRLIARHLQRDVLQLVNNPPMLASSVVAILVSVIFDLAIKDVSVMQVPTRYPVVFSFVHIVMGTFVLFGEYEVIYNNTLCGSISTLERTVAEQERQFALSRSNIAAINRRCHDIRHHILRVLAEGSDTGGFTSEQLAQVAREIDVYEGVLRTGNAALDVVLTEKGLLARQEGITLSCVADGHALDFMPAADLYALFTALLDGALAPVRVQEDKRRKSISLNVRERMGMVAISVEHYMHTTDATPEEVRQGYNALLTIQDIVGRYDGTLSYSGTGTEVMHLNVLIPQG